jgi:hypothetical protein
MRLLPSVWISLILLAIAFAVGGGGGGSSGGGGGSPPKKDYTLTYNFTCPDNVLVVQTKEGRDALNGVTIYLHLQGFRIATETTDSNGEARFSISGSSSNYRVYASKEEYKTRDIDLQIEHCPTEGGEPAALLFCSEGTRPERVRCRLNLDPTYIRSVQYIPEECRALGEANPWAQASVQSQCVKDYQFFQTCQWRLETDAEREACMRPKLNISEEVHTIVTQCREQPGTSRALCMQQVKEHVFLLTRFRMYNLEYKAEELTEAGVNEDDVVAIVVKIQEAKIAFGRAASISEKKEVVRQLQRDWHDFVEDAKLQLGIGA